MRILVFSFIFIFCSVSFGEQTELRFRAYTKVSGQDQITLGDIIENKNEMSKELMSLKKIVLGDSPLLGEERVFSSQLISQILRKHVDGQSVSIRIPNRIVVANKGFEINSVVVEKKLLQQWKKSCSKCRIFIRSMNLPSISESLAGRPWSIAQKPGLPRGAFTEKVQITGLDNRKKNFWVTGQLEVQRKVPVASRTLNSRAPVRTEDFRMEWRDVTYATDGALLGKELLGQKVKFGIPANQIIWANSVARRKAVKRGDLVRVTSGKDAWQITLRAVTEQDGFIGDRVNIRNIETKKILSGEVTGPGEVVIR